MLLSFERTTPKGRLPETVSREAMIEGEGLRNPVDHVLSFTGSKDPFLEISLKWQTADGSGARVFPPRDLIFQKTSFLPNYRA